jgi:hypothetical protein
LDVDPTVAVDAILQTAGSAQAFWATPVPLGKAIETLPAKATSQVKPQRSTSLPPATVTTLHDVSVSLPGLSSLFLTADRATEIGGLPTAARLAASSSLVLESASTGYSDTLRNVVMSIRKGVRLVDPNQGHGQYTLTSTNSSVPITISNDLATPVQVDVTASAVGGLPGFAATPIRSKIIQPRSTVQVRLPTHFDRTGRIEIQVQLSTPTDLPLGQPITLSVRSTALGTIGIVITAVAGVVLVVALIVRAVRRLRRRARVQTRAKA